MTGAFCEGADGVQSVTKSAKTWDLIALRETKSRVCDAYSVAHFPILPEASLFLNVPKGKRCWNFDFETLEIMAKLPGCHYHCIGNLLHFIEEQLQSI
jgi:hypothetical protein